MSSEATVVAGTTGASPETVAPTASTDVTEAKSLDASVHADETNEAEATEPAVDDLDASHDSVESDTAESFDQVSMEDQEAAATKIQAVARGRAARIKAKASNSQSQSSVPSLSADGVNTEHSTVLDPDAASLSALSVWKAIILVQRKFRRLKAKAQAKIRLVLQAQRAREAAETEARLAAAASGQRIQNSKRTGEFKPLSVPHVSGPAPNSAGVSLKLAPALSRPLSSQNKSPRMPNKAQDLLLGGNKATLDKRLDMLGISEKEMALYEANPKAYLKLGGGVQENLHANSLMARSESFVEAVAAGEAAAAAAEVEAVAEKQKQEELREANRKQSVSVPVTGKAAQILMGIHKTDRRKSIEILNGGASSSPSPSSSPSEGGSCSPLPSSESPPATAGGVGITHMHRPSKIYDKLGVTAKQLEMFPNGQSKAFSKLGVDQPHRPSQSMDTNEHHASHAQADAEAERLSKQALDNYLHEQDEHDHMAKKQSSKKIQDLTVGGHKKESKLLDKLGVSAKEIETFKQHPAAYKKLGLFEEGSGGVSAREGSHGQKIESTVLLNPSEPPPPPEPFVDPSTVKPASNAQLGKAQGVLVGVAKKQGPGEKEQRSLGISKKEKDLFEDKPKAYQTLGVFDTPSVHSARKEATNSASADGRTKLLTQQYQASLAAQNRAGNASYIATALAAKQTQQLMAQRKAALLGQQQQQKQAQVNTALSASPYAQMSSQKFQQQQQQPAPGGKLAAGGSKWGKLKSKVAPKQNGGAAAAFMGTAGVNCVNQSVSIAAVSRAGAAGGLSYSSSLAALRHDDSLPTLTASTGKGKGGSNLFAVVLAAKKTGLAAAAASRKPAVSFGASRGQAEVQALGLSLTGQSVTITSPLTSPSNAQSRAASRTEKRRSGKKDEAVVDSGSNSSSGVSISRSSMSSKDGGEERKENNGNLFSPTGSTPARNGKLAPLSHARSPSNGAKNETSPAAFFPASTNASPVKPLLFTAAPLVDSSTEFVDGANTAH